MVRRNDQRVVPVPKFQEVKILWNGDPRRTVVLGTDCHTCPSRIMKKAAEEFVKYGTTEAMTARRDHYGPSRGPSTQTHLDRFSVIKILLLLGFFSLL